MAISLTPVLLRLSLQDVAVVSEVVTLHERFGSDQPHFGIKTLSSSIVAVTGKNVAEVGGLSPKTKLVQGKSPDFP
jgi:hypothetical protein